MSKRRVTKPRRKAPTAAKGANLWIAFLVFALALGLYVSTINHEFLFDDITLIIQHPRVAELQWLKILSFHEYRPIRTLTYAVNYWLGGEDPFGYHLFNVVLHGLNAVLVFLLLHKITSWPVIAGAGAVIFASHPVQSAAVAYVSGRKDLLATFFMLLGCYWYVSYRSTRRRSFLFLCLLGFLLGVLSKEVAIVLPALLLLLDFCLPKEVGSRGQKSLTEPRATFFSQLGRAIKQSWPFYAVGLALAAVGLYYALYLLPASRKIGLWGGSLETNLGTSFKLFSHYLKLALVPYPLIADYSGDVFPISGGLFEPATVFSIVIFVGFLTFAIWTYAKNALLSLGMFWFLITLLPVLHIFPFHEIAADHFLYLPVVGLALVGGSAVDYLVRVKDKTLLGWALFGLLIAVWGALTLDRNQDWKNEQALWAATVEQAPGSSRANSNLGNIYANQGKSDLGIYYTKRSIELDPTGTVAWNNLGAIYFTQGERARRKGNLKEALRLQKEAVPILEKAIELDPSSDPPVLMLAQCYKELALLADARGRPDEAFALRSRAIKDFLRIMKKERRNRLLQLAWLPLAGTFIEAGYHDQALYYLHTLLKSHPNEPQGLYYKGLCYFKLGQFRKAIPPLEEACRIRPSAEYWSLLAKSYEEVDENRKAIGIYLRAAQRMPGSAEVHHNLGVVYHRVGERELALRHLKQALRLSPNGALAPGIRSMLELIESNVPGSSSHGSDTLSQ